MFGRYDNPEVFAGDTDAAKEKVDLEDRGKH